MLIWQDGREDYDVLTGDEAIRARLIQDGSIRTSSSRNLAAVRKAYASLNSGKRSDFANACVRAIERILRVLEETVAQPEGPNGVIAQALGIKNLVMDLSASMVSRAKSALSSPTLKSIGFYSSLKVAGHNAP